jgi:hypothetical protein
LINYQALKYVRFSSDSITDMSLILNNPGISL